MTLIAATTENPFFSVIARCSRAACCCASQSLTDDDVAEVIDQALADERGLAGEHRARRRRPQLTSYASPAATRAAR